ncbi:hypothetical protein [Streptomyces sp. NPDC058739]
MEACPRPPGTRISTAYGDPVLLKFHLDDGGYTVGRAALVGTRARS